MDRARQRRLTPSRSRDTTGRSVLRALFILVLTSASFASAAPRKLALFAFRPLGVDAARAAALTALVASEAGKIPEIALLDAAKVEAALPRADGCAGKAECLRGVARELGADALVLGVAGALGDTFTLDLKLLDAQGNETRRVSQKLGGTEEVLLEGARAAAVQLLAPELYVGSLVVRTEAEAQVLLDGRAVGQAPLASPLDGLVPGQRALRIVKGGYKDFERFVEIRFAQTTYVSVDLQKSEITGVMFAKDGEAVPEAALASAGPPPWVEPAALGTGAAALLALAIGVRFGLSARSIERELGSAYQLRALTDGDRQRYEQMDIDARRANVLFVVSGVLAAAAGVGLGWTFASP